jgi:hypothetical protein
MDMLTVSARFPSHKSQAHSSESGLLASTEAPSSLVQSRARIIRIANNQIDRIHRKQLAADPELENRDC